MKTSLTQHLVRCGKAFFYHFTFPGFPFNTNTCTATLIFTTFTFHLSVHSVILSIMVLTEQYMSSNKNILKSIMEDHFIQENQAFIIRISAVMRIFIEKRWKVIWKLGLKNTL